ncbi:MAG: archaetidylserine decarboxylase [Psittacicella sp.]
MKLKLFFYNLLPKQVLTILAGKLANKKLGFLTKLFIRLFAKKYNIDLLSDDIDKTSNFKTFNDFFTRKLNSKARQIDFARSNIISPVDGRVSQFGVLNKGELFQAKGMKYTSLGLLGEKINLNFKEGSYITQYLSPADYHRVHMPYDGFLESIFYIPGKLESVSSLVVDAKPNIYSKNERLVCLFSTDIGKMCIVFVAATIVGQINTIFYGIINKTHKEGSFSKDFSSLNIFLKKGEELGYFQLGSTIITIFDQDIEFKNFAENEKILMGETLGSLNFNL